jgi:hypothetical protein
MLPLLRHPDARRRLTLAAWIVVAALPVLYIAGTAITFSRNLIFWDEFDTALDLILRIDAGAEWSEILRRFFALNNEHRTVTSRVMFALSYWLTGTVNFHVIGAIGNLFLVGVCAILIFAVQGGIRRIRMGVVLAFLMFQLEHFESFIWSGSSIDHFQVVMLGVGAIAALARRTPLGLAVAVLLGFLATFTLAQGSVIWPAGAFLLAHQRRWRELAGWIACGAGAVAAFLHGFTTNPGHNIASLGAARVIHLFVFWLTLLGAPLTLGDAGFAPWPGLVLLIGLMVLAARGAMTREPVPFFSAMFAIGALALIAFGRSELAGNDVNSRYLVVGALAWAMFIVTLLELGSDPARPFRLLLWLTPALAAFTVSANLKFAPLVETFVEVRDRAATSFMQYGADGRGIVRLHPQERHADVLLKMAEERGVYRLPPVSHPARFPNARANPAIITHLDELVVNDRAITAGGWAMIPGHVSQRGQIYVVLRSAQSTLVFSTVTLLRPDVARAYDKPEWRRSGFRAVIERSRLPAEDFEVGVLIADRNGGEYLITRNRIHLAPGAPARAAPAEISP